MSLRQTILRNTAWSGLDTLLELIVPQLMSILVARALGPAVLGPYSYVMWVSSLAFVLGNFGVSAALRKYLGDALGGERWGLARQLVTSAIILQLFVTSIFVILGFGWVFLALPKSQHMYASLAVVSILPMLLMGLATAVNSALESLAANVVSSMVSMTTFAVGTLLALHLHWGLEGLAAALLLGRFVDFMLRWALASRALREHLRSVGGEGEALSHERIPKPLRNEMLVYCGQSSLLMLLNVVVWSRSEMFFIERFCDPKQLAFFSIAFTFATLPKRVAAPFTNAAVATLYAEHGRNVTRGQKVAEACVRYQALIVLPAAGGLAALSGPLIRLFYGSKYAASAPVLAWAMALGAIAPLADPATDMLRAASKQRVLIQWTAAAGVGVLFLDWILVRSLCAVGGAIANGIGQSIFTAGVILLASWKLEFRMQLWYLIRVSAVSFAMAVAVGSLTLFLPDLAVLIFGPILGVVVFLIGLRLGRVFEQEDGYHLRPLGATVPHRLRPGFDRVLNWLRLNGDEREAIAVDR